MNKEAIKLLTKDVAFWDNFDGKVAQIPRKDYDQALAILKEQPEPCGTCGGSGIKKPDEGCGECLSIDGNCRADCPCPDCTAPEQPPAGEFRETVSKFLREFEVVDEARNLYGVRDILHEACTRLDRSEAGERILEERIEKLSDTLDSFEASREKLLTACRQAFNESHNPEVEKILKAAIKQGECGEKKRKL